MKPVSARLFLAAFIFTTICLAHTTPIRAQNSLPPKAAPEAASTPTQADCSAFTRGVRQIDAPGIPGPLVVWGKGAFVVVTGRQGDIPVPVVAAAHLGEGRVVAFGHTGYFSAGSIDVGDTGELIKNAIRWAGNTQHRMQTEKAAKDSSASPRVAVMHNQALAKLLTNASIHATSLPRAELLRSLDQFDVICLNQGSLDAKAIRSIRAYVRSGHGLLFAGLGWGWLQLNPGKSLHDQPGNRLLSEAGIAWADGTLDRTSRLGFAVGSEIPSDCHALVALKTLNADVAGLSPTQRSITSQTLLHAVQALPESDMILLPELRRLYDQRRQSLVPTASNPLTAAEHPLKRVLLAYEINQERSVVTPSKPNPAAGDFPGSVPDNAPRVQRKLRIDMSVPGWHSTGLYAAPGETITIHMPDNQRKAGLTVRIGAHTDRLWHLAAWKRVPEISRRFRLTVPVFRVANSFGGLIYMECPDHGSGTADIEIAGAVEAPYYVLHQTTLNDWKAVIRHRPAPWAELESGKIIVTVPSSAVQELEDPESLMLFWDKIADAHATLATIPLKRKRPERYVADVDISAGYMHAGYPIMTHLDAAADMTQLDRLRRGSWGLLHELGHNHQSPDWTFDGTGEVTCNLFALHAIDTVCTPPAGSRGHTAVDNPPSVADYIRRGAKFDEWKRKPFLALQMYIELQRAFGWKTYKKVFAEYRELPESQRPHTDAEKRDQWMVRFSRACGRNLGPFFQAWGIPTSQAARKSIENLPTWMPVELNP